MPPLLVDSVRTHGQRVAVVVAEGVFTYRDLAMASGRVAARLTVDGAGLGGAPVCFLAPPGWDWVATLLGVWQAGGMAVPMAVAHPPAELARVLDDACPEVLVTHPSLEDRLKEEAGRRRVPMLRTTDVFGHPRLGPSGSGADAGEADAALMLYTSGTTGPPKGVVLTHGNLAAQVQALVEAWGWTRNDHVLLHLPLHHVHGIVNVLLCALRSGAVCQILPRFDAREVWERLARGDVTLYMAVPTVYHRLIDAWEGSDAPTRRRWSERARRLRLMVSGSAALPVPTLERWEEITGHRLLERYGMTEIGMALSNPLEGERRPGHVGAPLPGVSVRLVDESGEPVPEGAQGLVEVRGPGVFGRYWRRPGATAEAFTSDGWFRTGDRAVVEEGSWRILGRESVDILKTGGEKVSALEIEDVLRGHPAVADCAVVGVPDREWGERVCAAVVPGGGRGPLDRDALRAFARERLAPWKVPKDVLVVEELPRNAMGKVTKPRVR
ncbi:MAG TPA: acyl-CoA synthetase, partial [Longimicrobiales bacterium]|nr:acyl-CoA synthetase [Longimicrobiales bacterium]